MLIRARMKVGHRLALESYARLLARHGRRREGAEALAWQATGHGAPGDRDGAETFYRQAADAGGTFARLCLAAMREELCLAAIREEAGDRVGAEALAQQAADAGDTFALAHLVRAREGAEDRKVAEQLARAAAVVGDTYALGPAGPDAGKTADREGAESLYGEAADAAPQSACRLRLSKGDGPAAWTRTANPRPSGSDARTPPWPSSLAWSQPPDVGAARSDEAATLEGCRALLGSLGPVGGRHPDRRQPPQLELVTDRQ